jgi:hypothetical protein
VGNSEPPLANPNETLEIGIIVVPSAAQMGSPIIVLTSTRFLSLVSEASRTSLIGFLFYILLFLSCAGKRI